MVILKKNYCLLKISVRYADAIVGMRQAIGVILVCPRKNPYKAYLIGFVLRTFILVLLNYKTLDYSQNCIFIKPPMMYVLITIFKYL